MNYTVKATRIVKKGTEVFLEDYEKDVLNFSTAFEEGNRLKSLGDYINIRIEKITKPHLI